jgi:hypothetical protein
MATEASAVPTAASKSEPGSELMTNCAHFNYSPDTSTVLALARPSALFVNHYSSRHDPVWQEVRARGGIVITYVNLLHVADAPASAIELDWYMGDASRVPIWPYLSATGQPRRNWPSSKLIDIRPGSAWIPHMEDRLAQLITSNLADGIFCDSHGSRPWSTIAAWDTWAQAEQTEWALGSIDMARRADVIRRQLNERFQIIHNGNWSLASSHPAYSAALKAYEYCDGVCIEHAKPTQLFHVAVGGRAFNNLGQRRVIVIADNITEALQWAAVPGVTHVTPVDTTLTPKQSYQLPTPACVGNEDIRLAELSAYAARLKAERDALLAAGSDDAQLIAERDAAVAERIAACLDRDAAIEGMNTALADLALVRSARDSLALALQTAESSLASGRDAWQRWTQWVQG